MTSRQWVRLVTLAATFAGAGASLLNAGDTPASSKLGDLRAVGTVQLKSSCGPEAQAGIERAAALLHSFFYEEARRGFADVAAKEPGCALAHWGVAMSYWHPIWTPPSEEERESGRAASARAVKLGGKTNVERGLITALAAYYDPPSSNPAPAAAGEPARSCHGLTGGADYAARALAYEKALAPLFAARPDDVEVGSFYALALLATHVPTDASLKNPRRAAEILEGYYAKNPNHPGVVHYLIHAYDYPPVAARGLAAARGYAAIAPWVPHALHMPAHIFTRLGMWNDVIASNLASADAARQYAAGHHPQATSFEELHALDYLVYGYLQRGDDGQAKDVLARVQTVKATFPAVDFAAAYAIGAVPARYALERRQWAEAAALVEPSGSQSLGVYTFGTAHFAFARALGAARAGRVAEARQAMARLEQLATGMTDPRQQYFARQSGVQLQAVKGWLAFAEGRADEAAKLLREAADADDALGKHPVSPGSLLPAREILADFLLERGQVREALAEYEQCLKLNPGRLNSLYGAGLALERSGDRDGARRRYADLAAMVSPDANRPEIAHARQYLADTSSPGPGRTAEATQH
jgi:tetratricopeptide (TPR) repeat protein